MGTTKDLRSSRSLDVQRNCRESSASKERWPQNDHKPVFSLVLLTFVKHHEGR